LCSPAAAAPVVAVAATTVEVLLHMGCVLYG
jgi:hypothetical protein